MQFYVYIIKSTSSGLHYIGHTSNLCDRLLRHSNNRNKFTKVHKPGFYNLVPVYAGHSFHWG